MKKTAVIMAVCSAAFLFYFSDTGALLDLGRKRGEAARAGTGAGNGAETGTAARAAGPETAGPQGFADGYTDFGGFENLDDPLYRTGCNALLRKAMEENGAGARCETARAEPSDMRDAPSAMPESAARPAAGGPAADEEEEREPFKVNRLIKVVPAPIL